VNAGNVDTGMQVERSRKG